MTSAVHWYREAWGKDFEQAPPCPNTDDRKHRLSITGTWCTECGLRGTVAAAAGSSHEASGADASAPSPALHSATAAVDHARRDPLRFMPE